MRGEDVLWTVATNGMTGSPPHARGRPFVGRPQIRQIGITPACAGKTECVGPEPEHNPDHPRMRGEDRDMNAPPGVPVGSPPHARGRRGRSF